MNLETRVIRLEDARPTGISAEALVDALLDRTIGFEATERMLRVVADVELSRAIDQVTDMIGREAL